VVRLYDGSTYNISVPADNPYNPFQTALGLGGAGTPRVRSRFVDSGNRDFQTFTDFYQFLGGLKGDFAPGYNYNVSYVYSKDRAEQQTRNAVNGAALNQALTPNGTFDAQGRPLSNLVDANGNNVPVYNIFGGSLTPGSGANAPSTLEQMRTTQFQWGNSDLWNAKGVFDGRIVTLPAGDARFAVGGEYMRETLALEMDGLTKQGLIPGLNPAFPFPGGQRDTAAGFVEVNIPILSKDQEIPAFYSLEVTASGRYQTFDPGGDKAVPKVALRWQPIDEQVTLRGGYSQGFIAPSIFNLFGPDYISNPQVTINGVSGQVTTQTRQNPNLKPSESEQWNLGIVMTPKVIEHLTVSADYYNVQVNHLPIADAQTAANSLWDLGPASPYFPFFNGTDINGNPITGPHQVSIDGWNNLIIPWTGAARLRTQGIDLAANYVLPTPQEYGQISLNAVANVLLSHEYQTSPLKPFHDYKGTFTPILQGLIPDWTITASLGYDFMNWSFILSATYYPTVDDPGLLFPEYGGTTQGQTINGKTWTISDYYRLDFQVAYEFGKHRSEGRQWYDGTRIAVGINNLTDEKPPIIADSQEDNTDKNNYDILGRFVYIELSKKF
jgi:iron complex outermembrane receptor protein